MMINDPMTWIVWIFGGIFFVVGCLLAYSIGVAIAESIRKVHRDE